VSPEESFDSFYLSTRQPLLHQAFALTGDLAAAQSAVRDAYVAAWHHWRKVSARSDAEGWVRSLSWQLAQRRHAGRLWRRYRGLSDEHQVTLEGLSKLTSAQRRALLLVQLAGVPMADAARQLGVTQPVAEQHLQSASANLASHLEVDSTSIRARLLDLEGALQDATLPRASIIRRAGRKRRQAHAFVAAAAMAAVAIGSGAFAYEPAPTVDGDLRVVRPPVARTEVAADPPGDDLPTAEHLLDDDQIERLGPGQDWSIVDTHDNTSGSGINTICQQARFADPDGIAAIVREFEASGQPERSAVQTVEISESLRQAEHTFDTTVEWYAGCRVSRLQILEAYRVDNIGDQATVLVLRVWEKPSTTYSVAVARTGEVTTTTVGSTVGAPHPPAWQLTQSLADSVAMLCGRSGAEDCAKEPEFRVVPPPPSGAEPGLLSVADLPPVGDIDKPWVGTEPTDGDPNPSTTTCDKADFARAGAEQTRTRTYLIPQASVPARFGLSETYGVFASPDRARRFLDAVRERVASCEERDLATTVTRSQNGRSHKGQTEWSAWSLRTEISEHRAIRFRVGFVRVGPVVAQVTFAPTPRDDITNDRFQALLVRAGDRLRELDATS
jgi:DNA-directed RNA polymerase specialized sigma24 family protein